MKMTCTYFMHNNDTVTVSMTAAMTYMYTVHSLDIYHLPLQTTNDIKTQENFDIYHLPLLTKSTHKLMNYGKFFNRTAVLFYLPLPWLTLPDEWESSSKCISICD